MKHLVAVVAVALLVLGCGRKDDGVKACEDACEREVGAGANQGAGLCPYPDHPPSATDAEKAAAEAAFKECRAKADKALDQCRAGCAKK